VNNIEAINTSDQSLRQGWLMLCFLTEELCDPRRARAQESDETSDPAATYRLNARPFPPGHLPERGRSAERAPFARANSKTDIVGSIVKL
jgi:hypothetical protein